MVDALNPFTVEQLAEIDAKIELADDTEKAIAKAKSAGIDVGDQLETLRAARTKLVQIKRTYAP